MRNSIGSLVAVFLSTIILMGCGSEDHYRPIPDEVDREELLRDRIKIFNSSGVEGSPEVPGYTHSPVGLLVSVKGGNYGLCSIAHTAKGRVTANAHCIDEHPYAEDTYVIFYDKKGKKAVHTVEHIDYRGNRSLDDIAILKLSNKVAEEWEHFSGTVVKTSTTKEGKNTLALRPPAVFGIKAWSFDPEHTYYGTNMRFKPKTCKASRTKFSLVGIKKGRTGSGETSSALRTDLDLGDPAGRFVLSETTHAFLDQCDRDIIQGNSGSLMSLEDDPNKHIGVLHWRWEISDHPGYDEYELWGNTLAPKVLSSLYSVTGKPLFGVGTLFEKVLETKPGLLDPI